MSVVFNQKLSELDKTIISLKDALERTKQEKKEIVSQQRLVEKAIDTFKTTVDKISWSGEALEYLKKQVCALIGVQEPPSPPTPPALHNDSLFPPTTQEQSEKIEKKEELVPRPAKENKSNDFFSLQPTSNEAISNYFNVSRGQTQATYMGSNSQLILEAILLANLIIEREFDEVKRAEIKGSCGYDDRQSVSSYPPSLETKRFSYL